MAEYIKFQDKEIQPTLNKLWQVIKEVAPEAEEGISYGMPGFKLYGHPLVYFAAYKHHIGFYLTPSGILAFKKELEDYEVTEGTIKFPIDKPVPFDIVKKIVQMRINENSEKYQSKSSSQNH